MTKKRHLPKTTQEPQPDLLNPESLRQAQARHFRALEKWALEQPATVCGVPIIWSLNYDLIQVTNQAYLSHLLKQPNPAEAGLESAAAGGDSGVDGGD